MTLEEAEKCYPGQINHVICPTGWRSFYYTLSAGHGNQRNVCYVSPAMYKLIGDLDIVNAAPEAEMPRDNSEMIGNYKIYEQVGDGVPEVRLSDSIDRCELERAMGKCAFKRIVANVLFSQGWKTAQITQILSLTKESWDDIFDPLDVFDQIPVPVDEDAKFPADFYANVSDDWLAWITPQEGQIPQRAIEGDEIFVPTFKLANSINWSLDYQRDERYDVIARAIDVFVNGFKRKIKQDQLRLILQAADKAEPYVEEASFVKMLNTAGINLYSQSSSRNSRITRIFCEPEAMAELRLLGKPPENQIVACSGGSLPSIEWRGGIGLLPTVENILRNSENLSVYGARLTEECDLTVDYYQCHPPEYVYDQVETKESWWTKLCRVATLRCKSTSFKRRPLKQIAIGLDLTNRDAFVAPVRENCQMFDDPVLMKKARKGMYGWVEVGSACLDSRRAIAFETSDTVTREQQKKIAANAPTPFQNKRVKGDHYVTVVANKVRGATMFCLPLTSGGGLKGWCKRWW